MVNTNCAYQSDSTLPDGKHDQNARVVQTMQKHSMITLAMVTY